MLRRKNLGSRAACVQAGRAFRIAARHLAELCEQSPALMLALSGAQFFA